MAQVWPFILIFVALSMASAGQWKPSLDVARRVKRDWNDLATKYAGFYKGAIPADWILALICVESAGDPNVKGDAGLKYPSTGLMQVRWPALQDVNAFLGRSYTEADLLKPFVNIEAGTAYLFLRLKKQGTLERATMAYNGGDGNVSTPPTLRYLARVRAYAELVKGL